MNSTPAEDQQKTDWQRCAAPRPRTLALGLTLGQSAPARTWIIYCPIVINWKDFNNNFMQHCIKDSPCARAHPPQRTGASHARGQQVTISTRAALDAQTRSRARTNSVATLLPTFAYATAPYGPELLLHKFALLAQKFGIKPPTLTSPVRRYPARERRRAVRQERAARPPCITSMRKLSAHICTPFARNTVRTNPREWGRPPRLTRRRITPGTRRYPILRTKHPWT